MKTKTNAILSLKSKYWVKSRSRGLCSSFIIYIYFSTFYLFILLFMDIMNKKKMNSPNNEWRFQCDLISIRNDHRFLRPKCRSFYLNSVFRWFVGEEPYQKKQTLHAINRFIEWCNKKNVPNNNEKKRNEKTHNNTKQR